MNPYLAASARAWSKELPPISLQAHSAFQAREGQHSYCMY
jgi:hypothetical protein